jgi:hypothetical protein
VKRCSRCKEEKSRTSFNRNAQSGDGLQFYCRLCSAIAKRERDLRVRYGISSDDYTRMLAVQGGGCAICGQRCATGMRLAVDHDHSSGKTRGLLCAACNLALGKMQDRQEWLRSAAQYLDAHTFDVLSPAPPETP